MAKEDVTGEDQAQQGGGKPFDRKSFLAQIEGEATKKERDALKGKLSGLIAKRKEAMRAVAAIDKEIDEELNKFEAGVA